MTDKSVWADPGLAERRRLEGSVERKWGSLSQGSFRGMTRGDRCRFGTTECGASICEK